VIPGVGQTVGGRDALLDQALRPVRVTLVSIVVCVLLGVPLGTLFAGVIGGAPLLLFGVDIGGVPGLAYAFMIGGPIAAVDGAIVALLLLAVLRWERWHPPWYGWALTGSAVGVLVSAIAAGLVLVQMAAAHGSGNVGLLEVLGLLTAPASLCGAVVGLYGWFERRGLRIVAHR
jgi:peptidoglycan biosynthesis protein MviN/MurJ (putative lipid II flippase)